MTVLYVLLARMNDAVCVCGVFSTVKEAERALEARKQLAMKDTDFNRRATFSIQLGYMENSSATYYDEVRPIAGKLSG